MKWTPAIRSLLRTSLSRHLNRKRRVQMMRFKKIFTGLMLGLATNEFAIDMKEALRNLPVEMVSVKYFISEAAGVSGTGV